MSQNMELDAGDLVSRLLVGAARAKAAAEHDSHEGLTVEFAQMAQYRLEEAAALIEELRGECDKLREALKPFVDQFDAIDARYAKRGGDLSFVPDDTVIGTKPHVTYGDFRRAREALKAAQ